MGGKVYQDSIIVPNKCGSRYFNEINNFIGQSKIVNLFSNNINWEKIKYVVIRNPYEIFYSALHTEYFNIDRRGIENIINRISDNKFGDEHFNSRFYYKLFEKWEIYKFKIINIENLTDFVKKISGLDIKLEEKKHTYLQFSKIITKEDTYNFFLEKYPVEIKKTLQYIEEDMVWYEMLKSKEDI